jgi:hypothetical protein
MTDNDLTEWLENAIDDSFDLGWTSGDAARLIVSRMRAEGLVLVKAEPDAVERVKAALLKEEKANWNVTLGLDEDAHDLATAAIAAIMGRV